MSLAILYGAGSGALHAVAGPDHVLALSPAALEHPKDSWRIGLTWGVGHAFGTLVLALPLIALAQAVQLQTLAAWGERVAGATLLATAVLSLRALSVQRRSASVPRSGADPRPRLASPLLVGLVHGATGAGSLVLVLPVIASGSLERTALFLVAFAVGSTLAMAALTRTIAAAGQALTTKQLRHAQQALSIAAGALGAYWLLA
jgi:uncharacterized membrane protein YfcA